MPEGQRPETNLKDYLKILIRRRWVLFTFFIVLVATVALVTYRQTPIYQASTTLLIEPEAPSIVPLQEAVALGESNQYAYRDYYETQYKVIKSRAVAGNILAEAAPEVKKYFQKYPDPKAALQNLITVKPVPNSRLVVISAEHPDPQVAADLANAAAAVYANGNLARRIEASDEAGRWLTKRLGELKDKLAAAEKALQSYREQHGLVNLPSISEESPIIGELQVKKADLETEYSQLVKRYKARHPRMVEIQSQISKLEEKIAAEGQKVLQVNKVAISYRSLESDVESSRRMYDILLKRFKETTLTGTLQENNILVVDAAETPLNPVRPQKALNIFLAVVFGLVMGCGLAFFLDYLDNTIKNEDDLKRYLNLPFLGYVLRIKSDPKGGFKPELLTHQSPKLPICESFRSVRTNIVFSSAGQMRVLMLTSSVPEEGKSLVTTNLAITMAQDGKRVLLIDADMRKSCLHSIFNLDNRIGLSNYLVGQARIEQIVCPTEIPSLFLLPAGPHPPNPSELIGSGKMQELLQNLKGSFDLIMIDSPPLISVTDAAIISRLVDGTVLVVESGRVGRDILRRGVQLLESVRAKIIGLILNKVDLRRDDYYYYQYYSYYYGYGDVGDAKGQRKIRTHHQRKSSQESS